MIDFDAMAERLYGASGAPASAVIADAPPAETGEAIASTVPSSRGETDVAAADDSIALTADFIRESVPDAIKTIRSTPERRLFNATAHPEVRAALANSSDEIPEDVKAAFAIEVSSMAEDIGLDGDDLRSMSTGARSIAETYTPETFASMESEAKVALRAEFGDRADAALDAAKQLVARDPRVAALLLRTGLGSHPATVLRFARIAMGAS